MSRKKSKSRGAKREDSSPVILALAGLALIVLGIFSYSLDSRFVYDSTEEIGQWTFLHQPGNILVPLTFRLMGMDVLDFNRPIAVASLMYDAMIWGHNPFGYHLTNILLHAVNTCLVFLLVRHLLSLTTDPRARPRHNRLAFLATLLFALHPVVTEAVCEPSNRKDLLAALFGLTALHLALRHRPGFAAGDPIRLLLIPLLCLLAIGSKEVGAAYPAILALYWFLFRRREPIKFWASTIAGSAAVVVVFLIARFALEHHPSQIFLHPPTYPGRTLAGTIFFIQPRILVLYLVNLLCPLWLCADYSPYSIRNIDWLLSVVVLALIAGLLIGWAVRERRVRFAAGYVVLCLLPVCNFVPIFHPVADRYLYNPLIGLASLVAIGLDHPWLATTLARRTAVTLALLLLAAALVPITMQRQFVWASEANLWQDTAIRNPDSFAARNNLPEILMNAGRLQEARRQTESSLHTQYVTYAWIWFDYAIELERLGDHAAAQRAARHAISLQSDIGDADKMVATLQAPRGYAEEFARIAATLPPPPPPAAPRAARPPESPHRF
jgi:hypothetical protein